MKVLITGKNGQVGRDLNRTRPDGVEVVSFGREEADISDPDALGRIIRRESPQVIINAAAYTAVDKAESEEEAAYRVNRDGAANLAEIARATGSRLYHISTDFVFDGIKSTPYLPEDAIAPLGVYGKSKAEGEQKVMSIYPDNSVIVRTSWVYSTGGRNFVKTMLALMQERNEINVVMDQVGSPTWSKNLARALWTFIINDVPAGVYHWADMGVASWYDFAVAIHEEARAIGLLENSIKILPVMTHQYPTPAKRPHLSVLDTTGSRKVWGIHVEHWRSALKNMLHEYKAMTDLKL